jgi:TonB family protein
MVHKLTTIQLRTFLLVTLLIGFCGCSRPSPTLTVKQYVSSAEKGDVETMISLFSTKAIHKVGIEVLRADSKLFSELVMKTLARGEKLEMLELREKMDGDSSRVSFLYQDPAKVNSIEYRIDLSKENSSWKIDAINSPDSKDRPEETSSVTPQPDQSGHEAKDEPISAGVLNDKAIKLPQPAYPPVARAAHASGKVTVRVVLDETGKVIDASAVSGHPLLQPAAVAAAREAEFKPTLVNGKAVRVTGTIVYDFVER